MDPRRRLCRRLSVRSACAATSALLHVESSPTGTKSFILVNCLDNHSLRGLLLAPACPAGVSPWIARTPWHRRAVGPERAGPPPSELPPSRSSLLSWQPVVSCSAGKASRPPSP